MVVLWSWTKTSQTVVKPCTSDALTAYAFESYWFIASAVSATTHEGAAGGAAARSGGDGRAHAAKPVDERMRDDARSAMRRQVKERAHGG